MFPLFFYKISNVMFFYIGNDCPIKSLDKVSQKLFLDKGWKQKDDMYWYKGYSTDCHLSSSIEKIIDGYKPAGKWSIISKDGKIFFSDIRPFPIYKSKDGDITNIPLEKYEHISYDIPNIMVDKDKISLDQAVSDINQILQNNIKNFFMYNDVEKINVLYSAGLDTLTVWAILDSLGYEYNLHIHMPKHKDHFGTRQDYDSDLLEICRKKFWGYKMTSVFSTTNWYLTGFYSERFQIREVSQGHAIANYTGKKLHQLPKQSDYLFYFLQRPVCKVNNEPKLSTETDLLQHCISSVFYDHQMWHIDNNFHYSPFFDIDIVKVASRLSLDDLVKNALTGYIQKEIIKLHRPEFLTILSDYKNEGDVWRNYRRNFDKIMLSEKISKYFT